MEEGVVLRPRAMAVVHRPHRVMAEVTGNGVGRRRTTAPDATTGLRRR